MDIGKVGIWFFLDTMTAPESARFAQTVEKAGYKALWIPEAVGREPFAHATYLLDHTERLSIAWQQRRRRSRNSPADASRSGSA